LVGCGVGYLVGWYVGAGVGCGVGGFLTRVHTPPRVLEKPKRQVLHALSPTLLSLPPGQAVQERADPSEKRPAMHAEHSLCSSAPNETYLPPGHRARDVLAATRKTSSRASPISTLDRKGCGIYRRRCLVYMGVGGRAVVWEVYARGYY
jgi:hypothetical protein